MSKAVTALSRMTLQCPPEVLLRASISRSSVSLCPTGSRSQSHLAAVCTELGKPLQVKEAPTPQNLKKGQVLLKVGAAGINYGDVLMCAGLYQEKPPLPFIPGSELAGQVMAVGEGVKNVAVSDRVFGLSQLSAMSQYCVTDNRMLWKIPDNASFSQAASLLISYGTAYMALQRTAQVKEGETILVTAAAGALGLAAVDLGAHVFGCKVIGACGGPEKGELVKQKGADFVIDYTKDSVRERVKEITNGKGADVVIDPVGGPIFMECVRSIAFEGRLITLGYASGDIPKIPANHLLVKSCSVRGLYWGSYSQRNPQIFQENVASVLRLYHEGKITPHVSKSFSLQQVNEAFQFLQSRKSTGKVVLEIQ